MALFAIIAKVLPITPALWTPNIPVRPVTNSYYSNIVRLNLTVSVTYWLAATRAELYVLVIMRYLPFFIIFEEIQTFPDNI